MSAADLLATNPHRYSVGELEQLRAGRPISTRSASQKKTSRRTGTDSRRGFGVQATLVALLSDTADIRRPLPGVAQIKVVNQPRRARFGLGPSADHSVDIIVGEAFESMLLGGRSSF